MVFWDRDVEVQTLGRGVPQFSVWQRMLNKDVLVGEGIRRLNGLWPTHGPTGLTTVFRVAVAEEGVSRLAHSKHFVSRRNSPILSPIDWALVRVVKKDCISQLMF